MSATHTPNLNLAKPDREDYVSVVTAINDNMDILDGSYGALGTIRPVPLAIAVGDWTLVSGVYKATFVTAYVTATSKNIFVPDSGWTDAAGVKMVRHSGGGGIDCETLVLPSGTITGTLYIIDSPDGKIPVLIEDTVIDIPNGGTGQSSLAGIQNAFQIGDPTQLHTVAKTNLVSAINENTDHLETKQRYLYLGSGITLEQALKNIPTDGYLYTGEFNSPSAKYMFIGYRISDSNGVLIAANYADNAIYKESCHNGTYTLNTFRPS